MTGRGRREHNYEEQGGTVTRNGRVMRRVAIVGGGASATLLANHLMRRVNHEQISLTIISDGPAGPGRAYSPESGRALLNVPAGNMSISETEPNDFVEWLSDKDTGYSASSYVERSLFGDYLRDRLGQTCDLESNMRIIRGRVVRIEGRRIWYLDPSNIAAEVSADFDVIVLATGHFLRRPVWHEMSSPARSLVEDCLNMPKALTSEASTALVMGTGLSAVDSALRLHSNGFAHITLISRSAVLPKVHLRPATSSQLTGDTELMTPTPTLQDLRNWIASPDWRRRVTAIRALTPDIWRNLGESAQKRFLREDLRKWNALRHRMAPQIAAELWKLREASVLNICKGSVEYVDANHESVRVQVETGSSSKILEGEILVDACGLGTDPVEAAHLDPLWEALLSTQTVVAHPFGLGLQTSVGGVVATPGALEVELYAIGGLRIGELWESTAIPEIRVQAERLAGVII